MNLPGKLACLGEVGGGEAVTVLGYIPRVVICIVSLVTNTKTGQCGVNSSPSTSVMN